jgi:hypothetical protein
MNSSFYRCIRGSVLVRQDRFYGTSTARGTSMMDVALSIMALVAGGVTLELFATSRAPLGYQDESGFHFGPEPRPGEEAQSGNPS